MKTVVFVGVGGTGAKVLEALVHLAASGNAPKKIYPVIIDQDVHNGNVLRCRKTLKTYNKLRERAGTFEGQWVFLPSFLEVRDELLPLYPESPDAKFNMAIGYARMDRLQQDTIKALYNDKQLDAALGYGYKKRANMGSVLIKKFLEQESEKSDTQIGLKRVISEVRQSTNLEVVVAGSVFGGTGASGIVHIGEFFKRYLDRTPTMALLLLPYFVVAESDADDDPDAGLVRSMGDMLATKAAIEMYRKELEESFDRIVMIGSDHDNIHDDKITKQPHAGGQAQTNPSHFFEVLAASAVSRDDFRKSTGAGSSVSDVRSLHHAGGYPTTRYQSYIEVPRLKKRAVSGPRRVTPHAFSFWSLLPDSELDRRRIVLVRSFANLLVEAEVSSESWRRRQCWYPPKKQDSILLAEWGERHHRFWMEMSNGEVDGRKWNGFYLQDLIWPDYAHLSAALSKQLGYVGNTPQLPVRKLGKWAAESVGDVLRALNSLAPDKPSGRRSP